MVKRKVIKIDQDKCNGCGLCIPSCHESAIQVIEGAITASGKNLPFTKVTTEIKGDRLK